jgi:hypothetical protein
MPANTHHSKWRSIFGAAPLLATAFVVLAFVEGEHGIFRMRGVQLGWLAVAAIGVLVSVWTARRLGSVATTAIGQAVAGRVSLSGRAQALPGAAPMQSPDGLACLWFTHSQKIARRYDASDSVRPFLLVDASGQCVVLPAGAEIHGTSKSTIARSVKLTDSTDITGRGASIGTGERVLCEGDTLHVSGWFAPASAEAIALQTEAATLNTKVDFVPPIAPMALPVVAGHGVAEPFIISIGSDDSDAAIYWLLAVVDGLVFCIAAGVYLWVSPAS